MAGAARNDESTIGGSGTPHVLYPPFELGVEEWKIAFARNPGNKPWVRVTLVRDLKPLARDRSSEEAVCAVGDHTRAQLLRSGV
jgi:hypothetical protein